MKEQSKTGKQLTDEHNQWKLKGLTKEKAILFLFIEMNKQKAESIGMDFSDNMGREFNISVNIGAGLIDDKPQLKSDVKNIKIPSYVR